ncbi:MAG: Pycsar system effector family protein [Betaproteobacteria bacterium]
MSGMESGKRAVTPVPMPEPTVPGRPDRSELTLRLDQAWRILGLNQELIRSADQKIYLLIVMSTLLVSYVATNIDKIMRLGMVQNVLLVMFILVSGTFYFFALSTLFPRRVPGEVKNAKLIFFGDIASRPDADNYIGDISKVPLDELFEDLARQIYLVSKVATLKYIAYRRAWRSILTEVGLFVVLEFSMVIF